MIEIKTVVLKDLGETVLTCRQKETVTQHLLTAATTVPEGGCLVVDLSGIELVSFKLCADVADVFIRTRVEGRRILENKSLIIYNPNTESLEVIAGVLQLKGDAALTVRPGEKPHVVGHLPGFLQQTFDIVRDYGPITANQLADHLHIKVGAVAERLRRLIAWGFVARSSKPSTRKPLYEYSVVNPFA